MNPWHRMWVWCDKGVFGDWVPLEGIWCANGILRKNIFHRKQWMNPEGDFCLRYKGYCWTAGRLC